MSSYLFPIFLILTALLFVLITAGPSNSPQPVNEIATVLSSIQHNLSISHHLNQTEARRRALSSLECDAFMKPIIERQQQCLQSSPPIVEICVYFASDYNYLIPYIAHHLALGFKRILIYNNDEEVAWYKHPTIMCYLSYQVIEIQPWFGEAVLFQGLNHCYSRIARRYDTAKLTLKPLDKEKLAIGRPTINPNIWATHFDIDEMLVLHQDECVGNFVEHFSAPAVGINWAFFIPESPLNDYAKTDNIDLLSRAHKKAISFDENGRVPVVLPHERLLRRWYFNSHVKAISRITCVAQFERSGHCPRYIKSCPYGSMPRDTLEREFDCPFTEPFKGPDYPVAQLNHYWTLSLPDFLRKIHRGRGGRDFKHTDGFRSTSEFFEHSLGHNFVDDMMMIEKYGSFFQLLKQICPHCFEVAYYQK